MTTRRNFLSLSAAAAATALVAGCSSSSTKSSSSSSSGSSGAVVNLEFWTWATNIAQVAAIWNAKHPKIQVKVNSQTQGDALYTKLITATKAGNAPDIAQVEYQALPSMITAGVVTDINSEKSALSGKFTSALSNLVTFNGKLYGIPQDSAPMLMLYRKDLYDQYGLTVPTTWADFATQAQALKAKAPTASLTTFSSGDPGWFSGLAAQAGGKWWSTSGKKWSVGIDDAATQKVASYWQGLVNTGVIDGQPMYTPQWNKQLNDGTLLTFVTAVWGAAVLEGITPDTKGKWASAPLPAWTAGEAASGQWGGSSDVVCTGTKHKAEALEFLTWLNTSSEALDALISKGGLYPAALSGQSSSALSAAPSFLPAETDFYANVKKIGSGVKTFTWGPDVTVAYSAYTDAFGKAITTKGSFTDALASMQATTVADMKKSGFSVSAA